MIFSMRRVTINLPVPTVTPSPRRPPTLPSVEAESAILKLLQGRKFWIATSTRPAWSDFPAHEVARLLILRMSRPEVGAEMLINGKIFMATPSVRIRAAVTIARVENPNEYLFEPDIRARRSNGTPALVSSKPKVPR
jgi:hypothetical protein